MSQNVTSKNIQSKWFEQMKTNHQFSANKWKFANHQMTDLTIKQTRQNQKIRQGFSANKTQEIIKKMVEKVPKMVAPSLVMVTSPLGSWIILSIPLGPKEVLMASDKALAAWMFDFRISMGFDFFWCIKPLLPLLCGLGAIFLKFVFSRGGFKNDFLVLQNLFGLTHVLLLQK